jgi:hypothetical protein
LIGEVAPTVRIHEGPPYGDVNEGLESGVLHLHGSSTCPPGGNTVDEFVFVAPFPAANAIVWPRRVALRVAVVDPRGTFARLPHEFDTMSIHGCEAAQLSPPSPRPSTMTIKAFGFEP